MKALGIRNLGGRRIVVATYYHCEKGDDSAPGARRGRRNWNSEFATATMLHRVFIYFTLLLSVYRAAALAYRQGTVTFFIIGRDGTAPRNCHGSVLSYTLLLSNVFEAQNSNKTLCLSILPVAEQQQSSRNPQKPPKPITIDIFGSLSLTFSLKPGFTSKNV